MPSDDYDLTLTGDLDQSLDISQEEFMKKIEGVIQKSIQEKDPTEAIGLCRWLIAASQLSGLGLAKVLYELRANWWKFDIDEDFVDYIYKEIGRHRHTVERYLKIADMLYHYAPKDVVPSLEKLPIGSLVPIASTVTQGYQLEPEDWDEFSQAETTQDVRRIVREIRFGISGQRPRKSMLSLWLDRNGTIWAFNNDGDRSFVGTLNTRDAETNDFIAKAIDRIISNAGILKQ